MSDVGAVAALYQQLADVMNADRPCEGQTEHAAIPARWWSIQSCGCGPWAYCNTCHDGLIAALNDQGLIGCGMCQRWTSIRLELIG